MSTIRQARFSVCDGVDLQAIYCQCPPERSCHYSRYHRHRLWFPERRDSTRSRSGITKHRWKSRSSCLTLTWIGISPPSPHSPSVSAFRRTETFHRALRRPGLSLPKRNPGEQREKSFIDDRDNNPKNEDLERHLIVSTSCTMESGREPLQDHGRFNGHQHSHNTLASCRSAPVLHPKPDAPPKWCY